MLNVTYQKNKNSNIMSKELYCNNQNTDKGTLTV